MNLVIIAKIMKQIMDNELLKAFGYCASLQLLKIELLDKSKIICFILTIL